MTMHSTHFENARQADELFFFVPGFVTHNFAEGEWGAAGPNELPLQDCHNAQMPRDA